MRYITQNLSGSVSTPEIGSIATFEYFNTLQEYTAIIEVPHNITDIIGDSVLEVNVSIVPDIEKFSIVKLLLTESAYDVYYGQYNWTIAEAVCSLRGGHIASVASTFHRHRLQSYIENIDAKEYIIWVGKTHETGNTSNSRCQMSWKGKLLVEPCHMQHYVACSRPTEMTIYPGTQLVFTSENISTAAIMIKWTSYPTYEGEKLFKKEMF